MRDACLAVVLLAVVGCAHGREAAAPAPPVTEATLAAFVKTRFPDIKGCYEAGLRGAPGLRGKVALRFTVQPDGAISEAAAPVDTLGAPGVTACLLEAVRAWRTPFRPAEPAVVEYPFVFAPEG
jgi:hypothetical protein